MHNTATDKAPVVRAMDCHPTTGQILVGTLASEIILVNPVVNAPPGRSNSPASMFGGLLLGGQSQTPAPTPGAGGWDQQVVMHGHSSDAWGVAYHPGKPRVCASVCDGSRLFIWDTGRRDLLRSCSMGFATRAVTISKQAYGPSGSWHVAVGGAKGHLKVKGTCWEGKGGAWEGRDRGGEQAASSWGQGDRGWEEPEVRQLARQLACCWASQEQ